MNAFRDRLIDILLQEELGGNTPPDLAGKILARASPSRRRLRMALWSLAAAVMVLAAGWLLWPPAYPEPAVSGDFEVVGGGPVQRGTMLRAGKQPATLVLGGYVQVDLQPGSQGRILGQPAAEIFLLEDGAVTCEVTPGKGAFTVQTPIGTVSVLGTNFHVHLIEEEGEWDMNRRMLVNVLRGVVLVSGIWGVVQLGEGQQQAFAQEKDKDAEAGRKGVTVGNLVEKKKDAIFVKADGEEKARRFVPRWVGGAPNQGGGFDKKILKIFHDLKVGSRIEVHWVFEERLRALQVKVLHPPAGKPSDKEGHDKKSGGADKRTGTTTGTLVSREAGKALNGWIEVKGDGEEKARKYFYYKPPAKLLEATRRASVGSRVAVQWVFTNHGPMLQGLEVLGPARADKRTGTTTGTLVARQAGKKQNGWIEVKGDGEEKARKYHYFKAPAKLIEAARQTPIGSRVVIQWVFTGEGPVIQEMEVLGPPRKKDGVE